MKPLAFEIPLRTKSANESFRANRWALRSTAKAHRRLVNAFMPAWTAGPLLEVRLTRVSPGTLDDDNLRPALKHIRDGIAARLKLDDATPLVRWTYAQAKGPAAVRVEVEAVGGGLPSPWPEIGPPPVVVGDFDPSAEIAPKAPKTASGARRLAGGAPGAVENPRGVAVPPRAFKRPSRGADSESAPKSKDWRALVTPNVRRPK